MKTSTILKKAVFYLLFAVSSTLFFYYLTSSSFFFYSASKAGTELTESVMLSGVYLPFVLSILMAGVALVTELKLIDISSSSERKIYGISLVAFFAFWFAMSLIVFIVDVKYNASISMLMCVPSFVFSIGEVIYGIMNIVNAKRMMIYEEKESKTPTDEGNTDIKK